MLRIFRAWQVLATHLSQVRPHGLRPEQMRHPGANKKSLVEGFRVLVFKGGFSEHRAPG